MSDSLAGLETDFPELTSVIKEKPRLVPYERGSDDDPNTLF